MKLIKFSRRHPVIVGLAQLVIVEVGVVLFVAALVGVMPR